MVCWGVLRRCSPLRRWTSADGCRRFDTLGHASTSLSRLATTSKAILNETSTFKPEKIVYLNDLLDLPQEQSGLLEEFVALLENSTDTVAQKTDLGKIWEKSRPDSAGGKSLTDFLGESIFRSFCYDYAKDFQEFRDAYRQRYGGEPFAEPTTRFRWYVLVRWLSVTWSLTFVF